MNLSRILLVSRILLAAAGATALVAAAQAQTVSFGTMPAGGINHAMVQALGKIAAEKTGIKARIVPMAGAEQYAPMIDRGSLDFGVAPATDVRFATTGEAHFKGKPNKNLRLVAALYKLQVGFLVRKDSPFKSVTDLKGKKVPVGFTNQQDAKRHYLAALASFGMSEADFDGVAVPNIGRAAQDFMQGTTVATWFAVGSGRVAEMNVKLGGVRFLPANDTPEGIARMRKYAPAAVLEIVKPSKRLVGILAPQPMITEIYVLFGSVNAKADVVEKVLTTLLTERQKLVAAHGRWNTFDPKAMNRPLEGLQFHPAAVAFFKKHGIATAN